MAEETGTLETIAEGLANALTPLLEFAQPANLTMLLNELGIDSPPNLSGDEQLAQALSHVVTSASELTPRVEELILAAEVGGTEEIVTAGAAVLAQCTAVGVALDAVGTRLQAALATVPGGPQLAAELTKRVIGDVIARYLDAEHPLLRRVLTLAAVLDWDVVTPQTDGSVAAIRRRLHVERLPKLLSNPLELLESGYGWGRNDLNASLLLQRISELFEPLDPIAAFGDVDGPPVPPVVDFGAFTLATAATTPPGLAGEFFLEVAENAALTLAQLSDQWSVVLGLRGMFREGLTVQLVPPTRLEITPPPSGTLEGRVALEVVGQAADPNHPIFLLGIAGGSRMEAKSVSAGVEATGSWSLGAQRADMDVGMRAIITGGRILVSPAGGDGFLTAVLPQNGMQLDFDLEVGWSSTRGLHIEGGAGLATTIPVNRPLGQIYIESVNVGGSVDPNALAITAGVTARADVGPVTAVVEDIGLRLKLDFASRGNLGIADLDLGFKPPKGVGLAINAPAVVGGGFLRFYPDKGRYDGTLVLKLAEITVDAFGLVETRLPGGARGFSLAILFRGEFPPIQVGLGFVLTAVGGLIALNRRVDVDALRHRLASGLAGRILAPEDPIRNAPSLLADLGTVFPVAPGITVIGPTVQLVWADLVRFDIGVFLELPGPERVVILGSARASIDKPDGGRPYLVIRFDVVGVIDLQAGTVAFDAVLIDSQLLEILDLTGGAAFRLSWGNQPYAVLTVGGFNPAYNPEPLAFPSSLTRIAMVRGDPSDSLYLRFEGYFAITTNTYQFGAAVEAIINAGNFHIQGILQFDALIRRQPFHFQFDIRASVRVRYKTRNLGGLALTGALSGPGPVILRAKVCIEILFFDICFEDTFTLGSSLPPAVTAIAGAVAALTEELDNPANLRVSGTVDRYVALRPSPTHLAQPVVSPLGQLLWVQQRAPLNLLLQRIGSAPLEEPQMVEATSLQATEAELDWFAPGSFAELSDAEALNRRAFERLTGGLRFGAPGTDDGPAATREVTVRQIRLPTAATSEVRGVSFPAWLTEATFARIGGITDVAVKPTVAVHKETWTVADAAGGVVAAGISAAQAHQLAALGPPGVAAAATDRIAAFTF